VVNGGFDITALRRDYGDARAEAASCRSAAGLFDFSFMSRIRIEGPGSSELIGTLTPRRVDDLEPGRIRYALRVDAGGRVLGDLTIWRLDTMSFEVFSGSGDELVPLQTAAGPTVSVRDLSSDTAIFAVQGPASLRALCAAGEVEPLRALAYFAHVRANVAGVPCRVGRLATRASVASRSSRRVQHATWSGRRSRNKRARQVSPPPIFYASKRASCCSRTSCAFRFRPRSSGSAGSRPDQALGAGSGGYACSASKHRAIWSRRCGGRLAMPAFRRRPGACW